MMPLVASSNIAWFKHSPRTVGFSMPMIHTKETCFVLCYYGEPNLDSSHFIDRTEVRQGGDQLFTGLPRLEEMCLITYGTRSDGSEEPVLACAWILSHLRFDCFNIVEIFVV